MNQSKAMKTLVANVATKQTEAQALMNKEGVKAEEITAKTEEIKAIKAKIEAQKALDEGKKFDENGDVILDMTPVNSPIVTEPKPSNKPFKNFGEQMLAIANSTGHGKTVDNRLIQIQNASGANETVPSEGGFLVQQDFAAEIVKNVFETGILAPRCRRIPISANSNGIKINGVDETSRVNGSRWGGVQSYWANEAATVTATKPKFRQIELKLNKQFAIYYSTDELLADASALDSVLNQAFTEEIQFKTDDGIFNGDGSGKPMGILNAGCLVTVAKESGQAAATLLFENIVKMYSRMPARNRANAVWFINQDVEPQLFSLVLSVGTGGVPVYMPANGLSQSPYATLFGRPVIPIEHCATLGTVGDIVFADLSQYLLGDKGGMQFASSMHVQFLYDEMAFRMTYRVDGQPLLGSAITPYKGSNTLSPFVALATR